MTLIQIFGSKITMLLLLLNSFLQFNIYGQKKLNEPYKIFLENSQKNRYKYVRILIDSIGPKYGFASKEAGLINNKIVKIDSSDLAQFMIYEKLYSFPHQSVYGLKASNAAFLIVQHSNDAIIQKYFKTIKKLALKGEASLSNMALMEDRLLMRKKRKQLYGTQYVSGKTLKNTDTMYVYPIRNIKNIDKRRKKVGLDSFKAFLDDNNFSYPGYAYRKE